MRYIFETATGAIFYGETQEKGPDIARDFELQEVGFNSKGELYKHYKEVNKGSQAKKLDGVDIKLGDLVEMKSGSPTMVVNKLLEDGLIEATWFDFNEQEIRALSGPYYAFKAV